jgi:hypothetical protein
MPGINEAGTNNTNDYNLGRGILYFAPLDSNDVPKDYRDLGNVTDFKLTPTIETLEHQSSRTGLKITDKEVILSEKWEISFTLDELNFENLALFMSGEANQRANTGGSALTGSDNFVVYEQGRWYDLYSDAAGRPTTDPQGDRLYDIGTVDIQPSGGGTSYTLGTDYLVDNVMGRIFVIDGGGITGSGSGTSYDLDIAANASAAANLDRVQAMSLSSIEGALKFISENPAAGSNKVEYQIHKVKLYADGDLALIGDDWSTFSLKGTVEKSLNADPDSPYFTIITHENA